MLSDWAYSGVRYRVVLSYKSNYSKGGNTIMLADVIETHVQVLNGMWISLALIIGYELFRVIYIRLVGNKKEGK